MSRLRTIGLAGLAVLLATAVSAPVAAQQPALSPEESEAREMSMQLTSDCNPRRHNSAPMQASESMIDRGSEMLPGGAAFYRNIDGTFLVLDEYDAEYNGHCMVFSYFGPPPEPGSYRVRNLTFEVLEAEQASQEHSFFGMAMVRTETENSVLVVESGSLEIEAMESGVPTGTFEVTGFLVEGEAREDVSWSGSFRAVRPEG